VRLHFIKCSDCDSALTEAIMSLVAEVHQKLNVMQLDHENRTRDKESQDILDWLSPLNFWTKQKDTFQRREPGTGEWLLNDPLFTQWRDETNNNILWCPGERKSHLLLAFVVGQC
jgi:hypothetical protein